ncbi:MAG: sugar ABC transporter permease [Alicyclobacillus herbarius]|uniref:carbohydrate ABC transporter permease n=1 Tax=Alicyclobacillus herbarius TaxID=122960 RepID=UPI002352E513|nr:sugar ABC transporter permease [Alicyclobacillus herbarius]MCL6633650.1 sugar ABC transporter permease [Alicyclobacillus herbarius]
MNLKSQGRWAYLFLAPQLIGLIVFSLGPLIFLFVLSLYSWDGFGNNHFVALRNFRFTLTDPDFWTALVNTIYYTVLTVPVGIFLAILLAVGLNRIRLRNVYRVLYFMPVVTSSVAVGIMWMWLLNGKFGVLNQLLHSIGITGPDWLTDTRWVMPSIAMVSIWWGLGFNMILFLAGLQNIPKVFYEAAEIDGASKFQQFWRVTMPLLSPTTLFVTVITIIGSFQVFDQAYVITNGGPAKASYTLVFHIYQLAFVNFTFGKSAAAAVCLFVIILLFTALQLSLSKRWVNYAN